MNRNKSETSRNISLFIVFSLGVLFLLFTVTAFFPGGVSNDSLQQYKQALSGNYSDWHPPIMAAMWRLLMCIWNNPGVLLVFHNLFYWGFWCILSTWFFRGLKPRLTVFSISLLPPLWSQLHVLWKDTELSIAFLGCYLFLTLAKERMEKGESIKSLGVLKFLSFSLILFCYSAWVRTNSLPALLPLAYYTLSQHRQKFRFFRTISGCILITVLIYLLGMGFNYGFLKANHSHISQLIQMQDIVGVSIRTAKTDLFPHYWLQLNSEATPENILKDYRPDTVDSLVYFGHISLTENPEFLKELRTKWIMAIENSPGAYFLYRWDCFKLLLDFDNKGPYNPFHFQVDPNLLGLKEEGDPQFKKILITFFSSFLSTFLFRGWFYLFVALILVSLPFLLTQKRNLYSNASFLSALSALIYEGGYFFYGLACDFRYLYSTIQLICFSAIMAYLAYGKKSKNNRIGTEL